VIPKTETYCDIHPLVVLECPACKGVRGGKTTSRRYSSAQLAAWGRKGGRPRKKKTTRAALRAAAKEFARLQKLSEEVRADIARLNAQAQTIKRRRPAGRKKTAKKKASRQP
jgi:hypothetical protein